MKLTSLQKNALALALSVLVCGSSSVLGAPAKSKAKVKTAAIETPKAAPSPEAPKELSSAKEAHELAQKKLAASEASPTPHTPEVMANEARLYFYTSSFSEGTDEQKLPLFEKGRELALAALKQSPDLLNATFWWCANQGAAADITRSLGALKQVKLMEDALIKIKYASPDFRDGGAMRVLGRMYQRAPSIISIGSMSRSKENFDALLKSYPNYPGNWLFYADFLIDSKKKSEALEAIKKAEALAPKEGEDELDHYYWKFFRSSLEPKLSKL